MQFQGAGCFEHGIDLTSLEIAEVPYIPTVMKYQELCAPPPRVANPSLTFTVSKSWVGSKVGSVEN